MSNDYRKYFDDVVANKIVETIKKINDGTIQNYFELGNDVVWVGDWYCNLLPFGDYPIFSVGSDHDDFDYYSKNKRTALIRTAKGFCEVQRQFFGSDYCPQGREGWRNLYFRELSEYISLYNRDQQAQRNEQVLFDIINDIDRDKKLDVLDGIKDYIDTYEKYTHTGYSQLYEGLHKAIDKCKTYWEMRLKHQHQNTKTPQPTKTNKPLYFNNNSRISRERYIMMFNDLKGKGYLAQDSDLETWLQIVGIDEPTDKIEPLKWEGTQIELACLVGQTIGSKTNNKWQVCEAVFLKIDGTKPNIKTMKRDYSTDSQTFSDTEKGKNLYAIITT